MGGSLNKHSYFYFVLFFILSVVPSIPLLDYFKINKTLHMILFFYLGYLLTEEHDLRINRGFVLLFSILFTTVFWYWSIYISDADILHKGLAVVLRQISAMLGILMMYTLSDNVFKGGAFAGVVSKHLLKNSYGIYLFHPMIIYLLAHFLPNTIDCFLACLIMFVVSIIISDILTELMRITPLRMFIGESKI